MTHRTNSFNQSRQLLACSLVILFSTSLDSRAGILWTLNDFVFTDGATATGTFMWDAPSNTILSWSITTTPGDLAAETYSDSTGSVSAGATGIDTFFTFEEPNTPRPSELRFGVGEPDNLDTAGTTLPVFATTNSIGVLGSEGYVECLNCSPFRLGTSGATVSSVAAVPEPGELSIMALGLSGLLMHRRKKRTSPAP